MKTGSLLAGILIGALAFFLIRVALTKPPQPPHFHANFAVFVDGKRVNLSGPQYSEEVSACRASGPDIHPEERVHLHNQNPDVVHVHHPGVTWGHLMANLGMGLGGGYLALDDGRVLTDQPGRTLKLVLNGRPESAVDNRLIASEDRLLISYGPESPADVLRTQFPAVARTAGEFNTRPDPAGCSGAHPPTLGERLRHALAG